MNDVAHGNKSATTQLESESDSTLCTKKSQPSHVLNFNRVSCRNQKSSKKPLLNVEANLKTDILTLAKEAISTGRSETLG